MRSLSDILQTKTSKLTVKELKKAISHYTAEANVRIAEYREHGFETTDRRYSKDLAEKRIERKIESLQKKAGLKSRVGEIGVGTKGKTKVQLQSQLSAIKNFVEKDYFTPKGLAHQAAVDEERYSKFKETYGDLSRADYKKFIDLVNDLKDTINDFKYELYGGSLAQAFTDSSDKKKFGEIIREVLEETDEQGNTIYNTKEEALKEVKARIDSSIKAEKAKSRA